MRGQLLLWRIFFVALACAVFLVATLTSVAAEEVVVPDVLPAESVNLDAITDDHRALINQGAERHDFQAEVNRLMDIIINSLYTHKEVFLRELISNSADALEKIRFLAIEAPEVLGDAKDLRIVVDFDAEGKTLSISDTGVGMTKQDLINNLGTVAKSGTSNFLEAVAGGGDVNLIGQFGVGFYSAFLVADLVTVTSKHNDDPDQHIWESSADASFTVVKDPRGNTLGRGTRLTLHLKEDAMEYVKPKTLTTTLKKYSQFVNFPIYLRVSKEVDEDVLADVEPKEDEEEAKVDDAEPEKVKERKRVKKTIHELKRVNKVKPIWLRPKEELTEDDYIQFWKSLAKDDAAAPPLVYIHFSAEGEIEFRAILYIPPKQMGDPYTEFYSKKHDIKLYVRRVLISDQFEDIIPPWLAFMKGVVDSDDLPLKVDRETLSQKTVIQVIAKRITRKVLDVLRKLAADSDQAAEDITAMEEKARQDDREEASEEGKGAIKWNEEEKEKLEKMEDTKEKYPTFWRTFAKNIKLGCVDDDGTSRPKIAKLLRYYTSKSRDTAISLQKVLERTPDTQSNIYYMTGDNVDRMMENPLIQGFLEKDIEVILLSDTVDESCISALGDYEGKKLMSIEKGEVTLEQTEEDKEYFTKLRKYYRPLTNFWKALLVEGGTMFSRVHVSNRLGADPVGVSSSQFGSTAFNEKVIRYQTFSDRSNMGATMMNKILEINPQHPIIRQMKQIHETGEDADELKDMARELAEAALLASGYPVDNPTLIANKVYRSLAREMKVDPAVKLDKIDLSSVPEPDVMDNSSQDQIEELSSYIQAAGFKEQPESEHDEL